MGLGKKYLKLEQGSTLFRALTNHLSSGLLAQSGKKLYIYRRRTDVFKISFKIDPLNHNFGRFY